MQRTRSTNIIINAKLV